MSSLCPVGFLPDDVTSSRGSTTATSLLRALTRSRSAPSSGTARRTSFCMATILRLLCLEAVVPKDDLLRHDGWCAADVIAVIWVCRVCVRGSHSVFHIVPGHTQKLHPRFHCRLNGLWRERSKRILSYSAARCRHETGSRVRAFSTGSGWRYKLPFPTK